MTRISSRQKGFTIVELLISTAVFSVMLLLATTGIIQVGRTYYKGITTTKTQETARGIVAEIADSIQVGSNTDIATSGAPGPNGERAFCVGNVRYTYVLDKQVKPDNNLPLQIKHGVWLDVIKQGSVCDALDLSATNPHNASTDDVPPAPSKRRELLAPNMRVTQFNISQPIPTNSNLVNVSINVIYGDHDISPGGECVSKNLGGQFCAVSGLSVFVKKRL